MIKASPRDGGLGPKIKTLLNSGVVWLILSQLIVQTAGVVGVKVLTNALSRHEFGYFALGTSMAGAVSVLIFGPLGQVVFRYYSICQQRGILSAYHFTLIKFHLILGACLAATAILGAISLPVRYLHYQLGFFAGSLVGICASIQIYFNARQIRSAVGKIQSFESIIKYAFPIAVVFFIAREGTSALFAFVGAELLAVAFAIRILWKYHVPEISTPQVDTRGLKKEFLKFGLPFLSFSFISMSYAYGDRWILDFYWASADVAEYAVLYQIAFAPSALVLGVLSQIFLPKIYSALSKEQIMIKNLESALVLRRTATRLLVVGAFFSTIIAFLLGEFLVRFFSSTSYIQHAGWLWVLVLGHYLISYTQLASSIGFGLNKPNMYTMPKLLQLISVMSSASVLVPEYGVQGVIVVFLIGAVVNVLVTEYLNFRLLRTVIRKSF